MADRCSGPGRKKWRREHRAWDDSRQQFHRDGYAPGVPCGFAWAYLPSDSLVQFPNTDHRVGDVSIDQVAVPKGRPRLFQRRIERVLSNGGVYVHFPSSGNGDLNGTSRLLRRWSAYGYKIRELTVSRIPLADTLIHEELQFKLSETISRDPGEPFLDKKRTILNPIDLPQGSEINV